jgi:hypothetical protein
MIAYHHSARLADAAHQRLVESQPGLAFLAKDFEKTFLHGKGGKNHAYLHAALTLLTSPDVQTAASSIAQEREIPLWQAEGTIISAMTCARNLLRGHQPLLLEKGLMETNARIVALPSGSVANGFGTALRRIVPAYRPLMDDVYATLCPRKADQQQAGAHRLLPYVAAQLMPRGQERDARFNALSLATPRRHHEQSLARSASLILEAADRRDIMLPPHHLVRGDGAVAKPAIHPAHRSAARDHVSAADMSAPAGLSVRLLAQMKEWEARVMTLISSRSDVKPQRPA